jgi:hypothetical protein
MWPPKLTAVTASEVPSPQRGANSSNRWESGASGRSARMGKKEVIFATVERRSLDTYTSGKRGGELKGDGETNERSGRPPERRDLPLLLMSNANGCQSVGTEVRAGPLESPLASAATNPRARIPPAPTTP